MNESANRKVMNLSDMLLQSKAVPYAADVHQTYFRVVTCEANRTGYTCEWHRLVTFPRGVRLQELRGVPKGVCFAVMTAVLAHTLVLSCSSNCAKPFRGCDQERQEKHSKCAPDSNRRPVHNNISTMHQHQTPTGRQAAD